LRRKGQAQQRWEIPALLWQEWMPAGTNSAFENDLICQCQSWAQTVGVPDWNEALPKLLAKWKMEKPNG